MTHTGEVAHRALKALFTDQRLEERLDAVRMHFGLLEDGSLDALPDTHRCAIESALDPGVAEVNQPTCVADALFCLISASGAECEHERGAKELDPVSGAR